MNAAIRILREERLYVKTLIDASYAEQRGDRSLGAECETVRVQLRKDLRDIERALERIGGTLDGPMQPVREGPIPTPSSWFDWRLAGDAYKGADEGLVAELEQVRREMVRGAL